MFDFDAPLLEKDFISEEKVLPLVKYFLEEIGQNKAQSITNDYSFRPNRRFWSLLLDDNNKAVLQPILKKYHASSVRLHCRPEMSVTDTHYDGGYPPTLGVCLSGKKLWSVKKTTYWDILTMHYGAMGRLSAHHTFDSMFHERSIWFHENPDNTKLQNSGSLIYLPSAWYHTVIYGEDVISFSITLTPKDNTLKLRGKPASFFYSPPQKSEYKGTKLQWLMLSSVHHCLHGVNHLLRLFLSPLWTLTSLYVCTLRTVDWVSSKIDRIVKLFKKEETHKYATVPKTDAIQIEASDEFSLDAYRNRDKIIVKSLLNYVKKNEN